MWFFPDDEARPHACAALFGLFAEQYSRRGRVDVIRRTAPVAAAMWRWPDGGGDDGAADDGLPSVPGLMSALMGARRAEQIRGAMSVIPELRPPEPYAYLHVLGVDPALQGRGLGGEVLERGLRCGPGRRAGRLPGDDERGERLLLRGRTGSTVRHEVRLAHGGPTVWAMGTATPGAVGQQPGV